MRPSDEKSAAKVRIFSETPTFSRKSFQIEDDGAVVGVHHLRQNVHLGDAVGEVVSHNMVVDAPAEVFGAGTGTETPPTVSVRLLHQMTETVDVAVAEEVWQML